MKRFNLIIPFLLVIINISSSQEIKFIFPDSISHSPERLTWFAPNEYRKPIYLNGEWEFQIKEEDPWQKILIPSTYDFQGEIKFRKTFAVDSSYLGHNFKLICYGINYYCTISVNNKFIGSHAGGYSSFSLDVPNSCLQIGKPNTIEINVKANLDTKTTIPFKNQLLGEKNYNGIYRDIYMLSLPELRGQIITIDYQLTEDYSAVNITVSLNIRRQGIIEQKVEKLSYKPKLQCLVELWNSESAKPVVQEVFPINDNSETDTVINAKLNLKKPKLWSPQSPGLYTVKVYISKGKQIIDATEQLIGLKDLKIINNDFYLNGQRFILNGINWHENYTASGKLLRPAIMEELIGYLKELNINAVQVVNHPPHPYWVDLCDRSGLFLLEELPLKHIPAGQLISEQYFFYVSDYLEEFILRDKNSVSVLAWGIGGPYDSTSTEFVNKLYSLAGRLDDRPVYVSNNINNFSLNSQIACIDVFDIDKKLLADKIHDWQEKNDQTLTIVTSFGSSINTGMTKFVEPTILQEIQVLNIVNAWKTLQLFQKIDGYFLNSLTDWQCNYPLTGFGPREDSFVFPSGLIDYEGNKRIAFDAVRSLNLRGKTRINPGLGIKLEPPNIFPLVGVISLLIFLFVYNTRRYVRENLKRIFIHPHGFFVDLRDKRKIPVFHTLLIAILSSLGLALVGATFCYFYRENIFFDHLLTLLLINHSIKQKFILLCWRPELAILVFTIFFLIIFLVLAIFFKFLTVILRKKYQFGQLITLVYWIGSNYLVLIPIGMVLYRILLLNSFLFPALIVLALIDLWLLARLIKAVRVIFIWTAFKSVVIVFSVVVIVAFSVIYYYQKNQSILDYLNVYVNHLVINYL